MVERPDWGSGERTMVVATPSANVPEVAPQNAPDVWSGGGTVAVPEAINLGDEWEKSGGLEIRQEAAKANVAWVLSALDEATQAEFESGFYGLPENCQNVLLSELALAPDTRAKAAPEEDFQEFATTEYGKMLCTAWRHRARHKFSVVRQRLDRVLQRLEPGEAAAVGEWWESLPESAAASAVWVLSGGER